MIEATTNTPVSPGDTTAPAAAWRRRPSTGTTATGVAVVAATALPWLADAYTVSLASNALILAVLAMSTQLLSVAGLSSFGQAAYLGVGAYTAALLAHAGLTLGPLQLLAAALAGGCAAALTAPLALRTRGTTFLMVTFAIQELTATLAAQWKTLTGGDEGMAVPPISVLPAMPPLHLDGHIYLYVLTCVLTLGSAAALLTRSRFGLILRGCADHEPRMSALGHRVGHQLFAGYLAAGALAGGGGALLVAAHHYLSPADLGFDIAALTLLAAAIGAGSIGGAAAGAILVVTARDLLGGQTHGHATAVLGVLFIAVAYARPYAVTAATRLAAMTRTGRRR